MAVEEIIFIAEEAPEGGFTARALGESIFAEGDDLAELRTNILDAVRCHFDKAANRPRFVRLHLVKDEILPV
ncbi:MAG: 2-oxoisovalerate dehydrogenase [Planctomycetes bacterium]|nr:2-oxoisovalerate dehydrogenase [Planctomycetota bacterium]